MKELSKESKDKIVSMIKEKNPELSEQEIIEKLGCSSKKEMSNAELDNVVGGQIIGHYEKFDENKKLYGWSFKDLYDHLVSVYQELGATMDARDIVTKMGEMYIETGYWDMYKSYPFPAFIYEPLYNIYFYHNEFFGS